MILIKNARIIDPKTHRDDVLDIIIEDGIIKKMGKYQRNDSYETIIEAAGYVVAPGLVDVNVHLNPADCKSKTKIIKQLNAAAKGGYTSLIVMPNMKPVLDTPEALEAFMETVKTAKVKVFPAAEFTKGGKGKVLTDMRALKEKGAVAFSNENHSIEDMKILMDAMCIAKETETPLILHEESEELTEVRGLKAGAVAEEMGLKGTPDVAEDILLARDCMLAISTKAPVHFQHISSPNSVKLISMSKEAKADISADITPYHISLMDDDIAKYGTLAKVTPPLQDKRNRFELLNGIKRNVIDMIATDHTPVSKAGKEKPFESAAVGLSSLELGLSLALTHLIRRGHMTLLDLIKKLSYAPAKRFHLEGGYIEKGAPADLVIFNEQEPWVPEVFQGGYENSPYIGQTLYGKVKYTICRGEIVYCDDENK